jgi:UDP-GlcNAc:undecaprenyl-phosphate GlcNAc-1-phosphate transferase
MYPRLVVLGLVSFVFSVLLTPLVRNVFMRLGVVDHPDSARKQHDRAVPRVGGIAIVISFVCTFAFLLLIGNEVGIVVQEGLPLAIRLIPAAVLVFAVGLLDDLIGLKPWQKLVGEIIAAIAAYWAGVQVYGFAGRAFPEWWSVPLTIVWLVLCCNAVNLIDGVDGLAAGVGLFATTTMLVSALLQKNLPLVIATVPLVGCLLGFLRYNFNPATIFLGDSGSLFIGFLLGCYGVLWSQKSATILGMTAPLMALSIPLLDTALAVARRFLSRKPIFTADRGHIHHRLLDRGLTPRKVALVVYALCALAAIFSLALVNQRFEGYIILLFCGVTWIGVQHLGYVEFGVAGRMFLEGAFRRQLSAQIALQQYEHQLGDAGSPEECWNVIENACKEFGFYKARLVAPGHAFEYDAEQDVIPGTSWEISVPITPDCAVHLWRLFENLDHAPIIAPFCDVLRRTMAEKDLAVASTPSARTGLYRVIGSSTS